jgi:signal transduction histidine kinase
MLAHRARAGLNAADPRAAVHHVVETARQVTGDPVWVLAVLSSSLEAIPAGSYGSDPDATPEEIGDVHRWAATSAATPTRDAGAGGARQLEGPWGAFVAVDVLATDDIRATLVAPREGRPALLGAERDFLTLVGEYAAATIEHSILLHRVQAQSMELQRLAGMQRDFLRGVTHDLQAPLTSIRALATEAIAGVGDSETAEDLASISHQADRLGRMVGQLLAMSRLEGGALEPRQEVFRPEAIVRRAWRALHADRPFELNVSGLPHLASADPDRYEQVIWAVLDNAVRYSPAGAEVRVEIVGALTPAGPVSRTVIRDQGIGMSPDEQGRAFERFYRADAARQVAPNGSGIGLHTADGLVRAMAGRIDIESGPEGGSAISITLPAEETPEGDQG